MKRTILSLLIAATATTKVAGASYSREEWEKRYEGKVTQVTQIESVQISTTKQGNNIQMEPLASTTLHQSAIEQNQIEAIKDLQTLVPNLFIPDYGSRITSSIYIRGLGARIDNPALGLNIDNVPYLNKNAFDTDVMDVARMEVLRGPQSTLYGRNTMGGVINIYTLSPMHYQGIRIGAEYSSGNSYRTNVSAYHKFSDKFALAAGVHYNSTDGFFENKYTGENADTEREFGGRIKLQYAPSERTMIENTFSTSELTQGGYPYMALNGEYAGEVNYNDPSSYDRFMVNNGLSIRHDFRRTTLMSVTAYQHLDDSMTLDQDFSPESYFTLTQATKEHSASQDLVWKSKKSEGYNFLVGAFGFYKNQDITAPVMFKKDGIEKLILESANAAMESYGMSLAWDEDEFLLGSDFTYETYGAALYHESKYTLGKFDFAIGARLDFEEARLKYHNYASTSATMTMTSPFPMQIQKLIEIDNSDKLKSNFFEVLPKATINYSISRNNAIYATAAKGYKAGGFNTQMFSDIMREELMCVAMGSTSESSVEDVITYAPEYSWNYEIGGHFANSKRTLRADVALFYIDIRDQQLTVTPEGTTGRMMTNAGRSRSYGAEVSASARFGSFTLNGAYGYTNAKFIEYTDYVDEEEVDYAGNYVPYAPQQTLSAAAIYSLNIGKNWLQNIDFEFNTTAAGKIYWNEANTIEQPFYALLGAAIRFKAQKYNLAIWGRNLTNKDYNTFYFESIGSQFVQQGKPMTFGATLNINL